MGLSKYFKDKGSRRLGPVMINERERTVTFLADGPTNIAELVIAAAIRQGWSMSGEYHVYTPDGTDVGGINVIALTQGIDDSSLNGMEKKKIKRAINSMSEKWRDALEQEFIRPLLKHAYDAETGDPKAEKLRMSKAMEFMHDLNNGALNLLKASVAHAENMDQVAVMMSMTMTLVVSVLSANSYVAFASEVLETADKAIDELQSLGRITEDDAQRYRQGFALGPEACVKEMTQVVSSGLRDDPDGLWSSLQANTDIATMFKSGENK